MFCFDAERDVAEELSRRNLGDDRAEAVQARVESRVLEAYRAIVAEEIGQARRTGARAPAETTRPTLPAGAMSPAEETADGAHAHGVVVPDNERRGLPAGTRIYDAAGRVAPEADPVVGQGPADPEEGQTAATQAVAPPRGDPRPGWNAFAVIPDDLAVDHNPDGTLTAPAREARLAEQDQLLEARLARIGEVEITVEGDISDAHLEALLGPTRAREQWPELVAYLSRTDRDAAAGPGSRADRNSPLSEYLVRDLHPRVRVAHDRALSEHDPRFGALARALALVHDAGLQFERDLLVLFPRYGQTVDVRLVDGRAEAERTGRAPSGSYFPPGALVMDPLVLPARSDRAYLDGRYAAVADLTADRLVAVTVHELVHHLHHAYNPGLMLGVPNMRFTPEVHALLEHAVSAYAVKNPGEAVAELLAKKILGFRLSDWEENLLDALGAPRPWQPALEHLGRSPSAADEAADAVAAELRPFLPNEQDPERVADAVRGLSAGERRMDRWLLAHAVEWLLEGDDRAATPLEVLPYLFPGYHHGSRVDGEGERRLLSGADLRRTHVWGGDRRPVALDFSGEPATTPLRRYLGAAGQPGRPEHSLLLESGVAGQDGEIPQEARTLRVVPPWSADIGQGGTYFVVAHATGGEAARPAFYLAAQDGGQVAVSPRVFARLLYGDPGFQAAASRGLASVTLMAGGAGGPGGPARELADELTVLAGRPIRLYASTTGVDVGPGGLVVHDGGHWEIFGPGQPAHDRLIADELAQALELDWRYAEDDPGAWVSLSDRRSTLELIGEVWGAHEESLQEEPDTLRLGHTEPLLRDHARRDIVQWAALRLLRNEPELERRIRWVEQSVPGEEDEPDRVVTLSPEAWADLGWRQGRLTGARWEVVRSTPADSRTVEALTDPSRFTRYHGMNEPTGAHPNEPTGAHPNEPTGAHPNELAGAHSNDEERVYVREGTGGDVRRAAFRVQRLVREAGGFPEVTVTVRLALTPGSGVRESLKRRLQQRVTGAVDRHLVPQAGLDFPGGARLRFAVEHVTEAGSPHLTVQVAAAGQGARERTWAYDAPPRALAEAVARQLGLDQAGPFSPDEQLLGRGHLRLLRALTGFAENLRDRLGWVGVDPGTGNDRLFLDSSVPPPGVAPYAMRQEFALLSDDPGTYARDPDGTLAPSAQNLIVEFHQRGLAARLRAFANAGVTVAEGISDRLLTASLDPTQDSVYWPELLTYLARADRDAQAIDGSGSRADRNSPLDTYLLRVPHPRVRVQHDPALRRDDPRFAAIDHALRLLLGSGHKLEKDLWILLPKYEDAVTLAIEEGSIVRRRAGSGDIAAYFPPEQLVVGPLSIYPLSNAWDLQQGGHFAVAERMQNRLAFGILHELAHYLHYTAHPERMLDMVAMRFHPEVRELIQRVSRYAASNPNEAVAELLTKEMAGFPLEEWEEELLRTLGAPRPGPPTPEHLDPRLSAEQVDMVAGKVARHLGGPVDRERVAAAIGSLSPGERRLDLRLVTGAVLRVLEGGSPQQVSFSALGPSTLRGGAVLDVGVAEEQLAEVLDDESDGQDCAVRLEQAARLWHPRSLVPRDDLALRPGAPEDRLAATVGGRWRPVGGSLDAVTERVRQLGRGATAFLLASPPDLAGLSGPVNTRHAYALRNLGDGLYWVETQARRGQRFRAAGGPSSRIPAPPVGTRVIVVGPDGRAVADPFGDVMPLAGVHDALLAPASGHRYGASRELAGRRSARGGHAPALAPAPAPASDQARSAAEGRVVPARARRARNRLRRPAPAPARALDEALAALNTVGLLPSTGTVADWEAAINRVRRASPWELELRPGRPDDRPEPARRLSERLRREGVLLDARRELDNRAFVADRLPAARRGGWQAALRRLSSYWLPVDLGNWVSPDDPHRRGEFAAVTGVFVKAAIDIQPVLVARADAAAGAPTGFAGWLDRAAALAKAESVLEAPNLRLLGDHAAVRAWQEAARGERATVLAALAWELGMTGNTESEAMGLSDAQRTEVDRILALSGAHRDSYTRAAEAVRPVLAARAAGAAATTPGDLTALADRDAVVDRAESALHVLESRGGPTAVPSAWAEAVSGERAAIDQGLAGEFGIAQADPRFAPLRTTARWLWAANGDDRYLSPDLVRALYWVSHGYAGEASAAAPPNPADRVAGQGAVTATADPGGARAPGPPSPATRPDRTPRPRPGQRLLPISPSGDAADYELIGQLVGDAEWRRWLDAHAATAGGDAAADLIGRVGAAIDDRVRERLDLDLHTARFTITISRHDLAAARQFGQSAANRLRHPVTLLMPGHLPGLDRMRLCPDL